MEQLSSDVLTPLDADIWTHACDVDHTQYGAETCDIVWAVYAIDCATLESDYYWDCTGCECPGDEDSSCVVDTVEMTTQTWGSEITWTLGDCSGGPYDWDSTVTEDCCLTAGEYTLECIDSFGDGWHGATITIDDTTYCGDFTSGYSQTETVVLGDSSDWEHSCDVDHTEYGAETCDLAWEDYELSCSTP